MEIERVNKINVVETVLTHEYIHMDTICTFRFAYCVSQLVSLFSKSCFHQMVTGKCMIFKIYKMK